VTAEYQYDFADRQQRITVTEPGFADTTIAMNAEYEPSGPVTSVLLAGGTLTELRGFDERYFPSTIALTAASPLLDWTYGTDPVGNVTTITDGITPANSRTYTYEPFFEFLSHASGPWGTIDWAYDLIGNRSTEDRPPLPLETYQYATNGAAGNTPLLEQVTISGDGTRDYGYDPAGNQTSATAGANEVELTYDLFGRLAEITRPAAGATTGFVYDARGYLARAVTATIFTDDFESGDVSCWSSVEGGDPPAGTCPAPPADPSSVVHPPTAPKVSSTAWLAPQRAAAPPPSTTSSTSAAIPSRRSTRTEPCAPSPISSPTTSAHRSSRATRPVPSPGKAASSPSAATGRRAPGKEHTRTVSSCGCRASGSTRSGRMPHHSSIRTTTSTDGTRQASDGTQDRTPWVFEGTCTRTTMRALIHCDGWTDSASKARRPLPQHETPFRRRSILASPPGRGGFGPTRTAATKKRSTRRSRAWTGS
jgi:YD repeat-containing protein